MPCSSAPQSECFSSQTYLLGVRSLPWAAQPERALESGPVFILVLLPQHGVCHVGDALWLSRGFPRPHPLILPSYFSRPPHLPCRELLSSPQNPTWLCPPDCRTPVLLDDKRLLGPSVGPAPTGRTHVSEGWTLRRPATNPAGLYGETRGIPDAPDREVPCPFNTCPASAAQTLCAVTTGSGTCDLHLPFYHFLENFV